jgi:hypothetical protein
MKRIQGFAVSRMLLAALFLNVMLVGVSQAHAQTSVFFGKFTLTQQTQWGPAVLPPGDYTIDINSASMPVKAFIRNCKGRTVAMVISRIESGKASRGNALLVKEKGGQLQVYSLASATLGRVLVYDPALAREAVMEAPAAQNIQLTSAKR